MNAAETTKVLVVAGQFATADSDPWLIDDLVEALVAEGADVDVLVHDAAAPRRRGTQECHSGATVFSVGPERASRKGFQRLLQHVGATIRLRTDSRGLIADKEYDLCVYFSPAFLSGGFPAVLRRKRKVKHLVFVLWDFFPVHHSEIGRIKSKALLRPLKALERWSLDSADTIALMSPKNVEFLHRYHRGLETQTVIVAPWGGTALVPLTQASKVDEFTVVFGGQLTHGRGVEILIGAAEILDATHNDIRVLIIGSGPERTRLEELAKSRGLANIDFHDRVSRTEYLNLIERAHVGVAVTVPHVTVPSFPSKIVDYFRVGLPVIACLERSSDAGQAVENSGAGLAVEVGDPQSLADAILLLYKEHKSGALSRRNALARDFYESNLTAQSAARALLALTGRDP